jgi:hypothetical protein
MHIVSHPALRGASPETCRGRSSGEGRGRRCGFAGSPDRPETVRLMRRPRFGLVSRAPGGPGQPSAGITTGCPMSGAARGGDEGAAATAPDKGSTGGVRRRSEARLTGTKNAAQWSAGRRLPPIARRKETPSQGVSGGFASRSGSDRKLPRLPALRSPRWEPGFAIRRGPARGRPKNAGDESRLRRPEVPARTRGPRRTSDSGTLRGPLRGLLRVMGTVEAAQQWNTPFLRVRRIHPFHFRALPPRAISRTVAPSHGTS